MKTLILVATALVMTCTGADAVVLCAKPRVDGTFSASVKIRETCRAGETRLDPAVLGLEGPPGPGSVVKDTNDQLVGVVQGAGEGSSLVSRKVGTEQLLFYVSERGVTATAFGGLDTHEFESTDCSGQPFRQPSPGGGLFRGTFVHDGTVYYRSGVSSTRTFGSQLLWGSFTQSNCTNAMVGPGLSAAVFVPPDGCCETLRTPYTTDVVPLVSFSLSSLGLVPPFHVEGP